MDDLPRRSTGSSAATAPRSDAARAAPAPAAACRRAGRRHASAAAASAARRRSGAAPGRTSSSSGSRSRARPSHGARQNRQHMLAVCCVPYVAVGRAVGRAGADASAARRRSVGACTSARRVVRTGVRRSHGSGARVGVGRWGARPKGAVSPRQRDSSRCDRDLTAALVTAATAASDGEAGAGRRGRRMTDVPARTRRRRTQRADRRGQSQRVFSDAITVRSRAACCAPAHRPLLARAAARPAMRQPTRYVAPCAEPEVERPRLEHRTRCVYPRGYGSAPPRQCSAAHLSRTC